MATTKKDKIPLERVVVNNVSTLDNWLAVTQPMGSYYRSTANSLYGISHTGIKSYVPANKDNYGLTFFTRPQLNLNSRNIQNERTFYDLLTSNPTSIQRYIRCMLDPRQNAANNLPCPLVDHELAFIPVLTNNLKSLSGWPDITLDTFSSKQGSRRQVHTMVDSIPDIYEQFDINCSFRNTREEPISDLINIWVTYMSRAFEGMMSPYMDFIRNNELDYNTRIYRLVLDETRKYVKKIAACGAAFPINVPTGRFFDFNDDANYNKQVDTIDVTFRCNGAMYNDPILVSEFNTTVGIFNQKMRVTSRNRVSESEQVSAIKGAGMVKIPYNVLEMFNFRGYPRINMDTLELEWYINSGSKYYSMVKNALGGNLNI